MNDGEIDALVRSFEDGSLPRHEWTHRAHLVVALWYLLRHPTDEATRRIRDGIRRYNAHLGNHTGYHETITLAWITVIERFLAGRDRERPTSVLAGELLEECGDKRYLLRFYSEERLDSDDARGRWLPPDRAEFG
jgi:hypothetical protein